MKVLPRTTRPPSPSSWLVRVGASCVALLPTLAAAHEFQIHPIPPTADWCAEAQRLAVPGDVLQLQAGTYPGGCELFLGGEIELNEALVVQGDPSGGTRIDADLDGLSLRITGEPTRLYQLTTLGTVQVASSGVSIDRCELACVEVEPGFERFTLLFSELAHLDVDADSVVLRGNQLGEVRIVAGEGVAIQNTVHGALSTTVDAVGNLVFGDLDVSGAAAGNLVFGDTVASGRLDHNTLLGAVDASGPAANNLCAIAALPEADGNLTCEACVADPDALDLQPIGAALSAVPVELAEGVDGYCGDAPTHVGAVGLVGDGWTAHDRDLFGCDIDLVPLPPEAPVDACPLPSTTEPELQLESDASEARGCATAPRPTASWLTRRRPRRP